MGGQDIEHKLRFSEECMMQDFNSDNSAAHMNINYYLLHCSNF